MPTQKWEQPNPVRIHIHTIATPTNSLTERVNPMSLMYLVIPNTSDNPLDFMAEDEFVCEYTPDNDEITESLDDAINAKYKEIWS